MIAEVLLVLAGHPSSLFLPSSELSHAFLPLLHPGEKQSLEFLSRIAQRYNKLKAATRNLCGESEYLSSLCAAIDLILGEYETLVVEIEARVLRRDDAMVASGSFVPLSSLKAVFAPWDAPFAALASLADQLESGGANPASRWTPGPLIDLLIQRSNTGVERISSIMAALALAVQKVWRIHLIAYFVHGSLAAQDPFALSNPHRLNHSSMPTFVSTQTRESIAYVGRAVATVKAARGHKQLPRTLAVMHTKMLGRVLPQDKHSFDAVVAEVRVNVSEWLWTTVLTRKDVDDTVESL